MSKQALLIGLQLRMTLSKQALSHDVHYSGIHHIRIHQLNPHGGEVNKHHQLSVDPLSKAGGITLVKCGSIHLEDRPQAQSSHSLMCITPENEIHQAGNNIRNKLKSNVQLGSSTSADTF